MPAVLLLRELSRLLVRGSLAIARRRRGEGGGDPHDGGRQDERVGEAVGRFDELTSATCEPAPGDASTTVSASCTSLRVWKPPFVR